MSDPNRAIKKKARALAEAEGISYTAALRRVLEQPHDVHETAIPVVAAGVTSSMSSTRGFVVEEWHDVTGSTPDFERLVRLGRKAPNSDGTSIMLREVIREMERLGLDQEHRKNYEELLAVHARMSGSDGGEPEEICDECGDAIANATTAGEPWEIGTCRCTPDGLREEYP